MEKKNMQEIQKKKLDENEIKANKRKAKEK